MFSIAKKFLRFGVITGLVTGAAVGGTALFAGSDRVELLIEKVHDGVVKTIDEAIDDPAALRAQLRDLSAEYPERIAAVRGDLAELGQQINQLERERAVASRVVALADRDLAELQPSVEQAMLEVENSDNRLTSAVRFESKLYTVRQASTRIDQIRQTRATYANRGADAEHDLIYLNQQSSRLQEMLAKLESERATFQSQLAQLERQVDAIARNERLIEMMEERQETIEECSRYEARSLDQIVSRLTEMRSRQEAELDVLVGEEDQQDYESIAKMQLQVETSAGDESVLTLEEGVDATSLIRIR